MSDSARDAGLGESLATFAGRESVAVAIAGNPFRASVAYGERKESATDAERC